MKDWKEKLARLGQWLGERKRRLAAVDWKAKAAELKDPKAWKAMAGALWRWLAEYRDRVIPVVFLAVSLAVFLMGNRALSRPAARIAQRYLDAAFAYDYMELYGLFDEAVLEGELDRAGLDRTGMEQVALLNSAQVAQYVAQAESDYGVEISYSCRTTATEALGAQELAELQRLYDADGIQVELLGARRTSARVTARMKGADGRKKLSRELEITAIRTARGWSLDRDSMHAFLTVIYDLPAFAQENFGA